MIAIYKGMTKGNNLINNNLNEMTEIISMLL